MNNISFYIQLYKQGRLKYHSSINEEDCCSLTPIVICCFLLQWDYFEKKNNNRQWWALQGEIYSTLMDNYRTKNKMKQINCSNAGDRWHHSKWPPVDFTEKLFRVLYPNLSPCNAQGLKKVQSNNPAQEHFLVEEVSLKWARLQAGHPNKIRGLLAQRTSWNSSFFQALKARKD